MLKKLTLFLVVTFLASIVACAGGLLPAWVILFPGLGLIGVFVYWDRATWKRVRRPPA